MAKLDTFEPIAIRAIETVLGGLDVATVQALVGAGWLGFFEEGEPLPVTPTPSEDQAAPTMWVRWAINPLDSEVSMDGSAVWHLALQMELRCQTRARHTPRATLFSRLRKDLDAGDGSYTAAGDSGSVKFFADEAAQRGGTRDGWLVHTLPVEVTVS